MELTGLDYLIAEGERVRGEAYADAFADWLEAVALDDGDTGLDLRRGAKENLAPHEETLADVVLGALSIAIEAGEKDTPAQVLQLLLPMIVRFEEYLYFTRYMGSDETPSWKPV